MGCAGDPDVTAGAQRERRSADPSGPWVTSSTRTPRASPTAIRATQIAGQLVVSAGTVRKHPEDAFGRLGVSSRTAAVARAFPEPEAL
ncbi:LuxR C-terminal-related transcriptional regulator [Streptomyces sp. NBC_00882]|uniref:LuxR C-terminal-related transcriptional regulator n=1 Tax=Streptomyces TaxID=1883 RepID=UPI00386F5AB6|nr:LuxR C-terminal-related transcriptional regulator [Streptomyces sp. NBC_00882]WSZ57412.1 LuxR C-terminal-related transcriptional regulator [Streptomyces canus]